MKRNHNLRSQRGFTIVELLIVIVVIGILAALVLNAFSGVQAKARDAKRQTDVRAISSQLEAYFNSGGQSSYPIASQLTGSAGDTWANANWQGFDINAFRPPNTTVNSMQTATTITGGTFTAGAITTWPTGAAPQTTATVGTYTYAPFNVSGSAASVCTAVPCAHYILLYTTESGTPAIVVKQGLN